MGLSSPLTVNFFILLMVLIDAAPIFKMSLVKFGNIPSPGSSQNG